MLILAQKPLATGDIAAIRDVAGSSNGRKWGIFRKVKVTIGVSATTGLHLKDQIKSVFEMEYDARGANQTQNAQNNAMAFYEKLS